VIVEVAGPGGHSSKKSARGVPLSGVVFTGYLPSPGVSFPPLAALKGIFFMVKSVLFYLFRFKSYTIFVNYEGKFTKYAFSMILEAYSGFC